MSVGTAGRDAPLSRWALFAFAFPAAPISALGLPLVVHLPPFYANTLGLGLTVVGSIFMLARLWDVIIDPMIGILSDRYETRWGRRRHWIVLSVPIVMLSVAMIFMPQAPVSAAYLVFWLFVLYIGWTLLTISHMSWGAELTPHYHERSRVQGVREVLLVLGMVLVLALPVAIEATMHPDDIASARVASMGWFVVILLPITVAVAVWQVPERKTPPPAHISPRQAIGALVASRPLRYVIFADLISGVSGGIVTSLFLFLAEDAFQLGKFSSALLLCYFIAGVLFIPVFLAISSRIGKHKTVALSAAFSALTLPLIYLVPVGNVGAALGIWVFFGLNMAAGPFLFRAIMADVADHDAVETGQLRTGLFYSMLAMTNKIGHALAIGVAFWMLDLVGFVPGGENSAAALDGLRAVYVWPAVVISTAVAFALWRFPLDEAQQQANRDILDRRILDAAAVAVETRTLTPSDAQSSGTPAD